MKRSKLKNKLSKLSKAEDKKKENVVTTLFPFFPSFFFIAVAADRNSVDTVWFIKVIKNNFQRNDGDTND